MKYDGIARACWLATAISVGVPGVLIFTVVLVGYHLATRRKGAN